jgi:hypothetical protein
MFYWVISAIALATCGSMGCATPQSRASEPGRLPDSELINIAIRRAAQFEKQSVLAGSYKAKLSTAVRVELHARPVGDEVTATGGLDVFLDPSTGKVFCIVGQP